MTRLHVKHTHPFHCQQAVEFTYWGFNNIPETCNKTSLLSVLHILEQDYFRGLRPDNFDKMNLHAKWPGVNLLCTVSLHCVCFGVVIVVREWSGWSCWLCNGAAQHLGYLMACTCILYHTHTPKIKCESLQLLAQSRQSALWSALLIRHGFYALSDTIIQVSSTKMQYLSILVARVPSSQISIIVIPVSGWFSHVAPKYKETLVPITILLLRADEKLSKSTSSEVIHSDLSECLQLE